MNSSFTFVDHTADRRMVVKGETMEDIFRQAMLGLQSLLDGEGRWLEDSRGEVERQIEVDSGDPTLLLIDFLSEVLTYAHIDRAIYTGLEFEMLEETTLKALITGRCVEGFDEEVKAVTYHEAELKCNPDGLWQTTVIFDI